MANKDEGGGGRLGIKRSLPPDQEREKEKDGRLRRIVCDILTLRVVAYVIAQPAAFSFVVSLFLIAACMPALGRYIADADQLPDLFSMRIWNAYLGKLQDQKFCVIDPEESLGMCRVQEGLERVDVVIGFQIDRDFCRSLGGCQGENKTQEEQQQNTAENVDFLLGEFSGRSLKTKIKDKVTGERVDRNLTIRILLSLNETQGCGGHHCPIGACVSIIAPPNSIPTRLPRIPEDFSFNSKVYNSVRRPPGQCAHRCSDVTADKTIQRLEFSHKACASYKRTVAPAEEKYRHQGLINIYLEEEDQKVASSRLQLAAIGVAALAIAITIAIAFTDRPPTPKPSSE